VCSADRRRNRPGREPTVRRVLLLIVVLAGLASCDPVCDIARIRVVASDGRIGVPCVIELQRADTPLQPPYGGGPKTVSGAVFTERTYRNSGKYRLALACERYALAATADFDWRLEGMGCGQMRDLGVITIVPERPAGR